MQENYGLHKVCRKIFITLTRVTEVIIKVCVLLAKEWSLRKAINITNVVTRKMKRNSYLDSYKILGFARHWNA